MIGYQRPIRAALALVAAAVLAAPMSAQAPRPPDVAVPIAPMPPGPLAARQSDEAVPLVPIKVQLSISRYEGERRVSNLPFSVALNANERQNVSIRTGASVPFVTGDGKVSYSNVGTQLTLSANRQSDGRFNLFVSVDDSTMTPKRALTPAAVPTGQDAAIESYLRSFSTSAHVLLRDGQTMELTAATDKMTGEAVRVEVGLAVVK